MPSLRELAKQKSAEKPEIKPKKIPKIVPKSKIPEQLPELNKSIELNSLKTLYANRFGSTTNMRKADMQKALMEIWNQEIKKGDK